MHLERVVLDIMTFGAVERFPGDFAAAAVHMLQRTWYHLLAASTVTKVLSSSLA